MTLEAGEDAVQTYDDEFGGLTDAGGAVLADPDAEAALLGYLLMKPGEIDRVASLVGSRDFSDTLHRRIFECFEKAFEEGWTVGIEPIVKALGGDPKAIVVDGMTVGAYLARLGAGAQLSDDPQELAEHIQQCAERRAVGDDVHFEAPFTSRMGLKMWADQNDPAKEYEYIVEDLIPEAQCVLIMGESQTGKSFLTYHLGMCMARAVPFFGRRVLKPMGVIWAAYEAGLGAGARMRAYRRHHNLDLEDLPFGVLQQPLPLWPNEPNVAALIEECRGIQKTKFRGVPLGAIVVDTYNAATPGASEIDSEVVSKIRGYFHRIIEETGATLIIVGHTNASGKHRGNEQLTNNIDTVIRVIRKTRVDGREVIPLRDDDGREIRTMKIQKQREGLDGQSHDFVLRVVEDGTRNKYGKPRTSCVVVNPNIADVGSDDIPAKPGEAVNGYRVTTNEALFLRCVLQCQNDYGIKPPAELGLPRSVGLVVDYDYVKRLMFTKMLRDEDNTAEGLQRHREKVKKAIKRAREKLMHGRVVGCHDPFIWWTGRPVRGVKETQKADPSLFDGPAPIMSPSEGDDDFHIPE
ncbi:AAA family ATPase [Bradyrhizobium sp. USDA 4350]